jgi:hypothetical protein
MKFLQKLRSISKDTLLNSNIFEKNKFHKEFAGESFDQSEPKLLNLNS